MELTKAGTIFWIKIINRKDCCGKRLSNIEARVGKNKITAETSENILNNKLCGTYFGPARDGEVVYIQCSRPIKGQYVTLQKLRGKDKIINIAEVVVVGKSSGKHTK